MQILEVREIFPAQLIQDGKPVFETRRNPDSGKREHRKTTDGEKIPVMTTTDTRWHAVGVVSTIKGNDHLWLVEPLESDEEARTFRAVLNAYWPNVMRNDISATAGFTVQRPSVEHSPDLRLTEA